MHCSNCGSNLEEQAKYCSSCGQHINENRKSKHTWMIVGIVTVIITSVVISFAIFNAVMNPQEIVSEVNNKIETAPLDSIPPEEKDKTQIIQESMPKVFTILTDEAQGSGFLYQDGGYIVTNAHVVAGYTEVIVRNHDGEESPAQVIGISNHSDVALLKSEEYAQASPFPLEMKQSVIGTEVIAIGSPQGFENSASIGYLTGTNRDIEFDFFVYEELYQVDAQIDEGSSGGPLVDAATGKVIGINSLLYTSNTSFGFSIPLYRVAYLINGWISNPMDESQVAAVFGSYDEFIYSDPSAEEEDIYYDEYEDFWNDYYDSYSTEDPNGNEEDPFGTFEYVFDEKSLSDFIIYFRDYYEYALYYEDFYSIQDLLLPGSSAYEELEQYFYDISGKNYQYIFTANTITNVEIFEDYAIVTANEEVDFYDTAGKYTYYNQNKEYTVIITEDGYYKITDIYTVE